MNARTRGVEVLSSVNFFILHIVVEPRWLSRLDHLP